MSTSHKIEMTCPYCQKKYVAEVYDSVNVKTDPDLRERTISGDLFRQDCPHCHKSFLLQPPLIYSDPDHKFVIWLSQKEVVEDVSAFAKPLIQQGYKLRRCATVHELVEKIQIFEDGMDDVAVELAKYDSFIEFIDNKKGEVKDITSIEYQHTKDDVMKINIRTGDKGMSFLIPVSVIEEEMKAEPEFEDIDQEYFPNVNSDWIVSMFKKVEGKA